MSGGWTQRTREVIAVPVVEAEVTEHVYMARTCPGCRRRCIPPAQLDGVVMGQQRLWVNPESSSGQALISLIAMLREDARLPIGTIQRYLRTVHELHVSRGAIVDAVHRTARKAQGVVAGILERIRGSPVVHADETGWCEDGHNGYVWTFSTPTQRYFLRRNRSQAIVDEALGDAFSGVLVSDFYAAYHHYDSAQQRCWAHPCSSQGQALLRDIHDWGPSTQMMRHWRGGLTPSTGSIPGPKPSPIPRPGGGAPPNWLWNDNCWPSVALTRPTHLRHSPAFADASSATSRACPVLDAGNSSSSWPNPKSRRTTTLPSAACATWSSAARSAAAPGRKRAPRAR